MIRPLGVPALGSDDPVQVAVPAEVATLPARAPGTTAIVCPTCAATVQKDTGLVNRARRAGAPIYCGIDCAGLGRRKTREEKLAREREWERGYRRVVRVRKGLAPDPVVRTLAQRMEAFTMPEPNSGCHLWIGALNKSGYGQIGADKKVKYAHRVAYELAKGPIPEGLTLDHLCRVPACVNPDHLEPVTTRENVLRGTAFSARNARITHCPRGHAYDDANTYIAANGSRRCRACIRLRRHVDFPRVCRVCGVARCPKCDRVVCSHESNTGAFCQCIEPKVLPSSGIPAAMPVEPSGNPGLVAVPDEPRSFIECHVCDDGAVLNDTCDECGERHCPSCEPCIDWGDEDEEC